MTQLQKRAISLFELDPRTKGEHSLKEWEIILQDIIENSLTGEQRKVSPCWWQHTKKDIFTDLWGLSQSGGDFTQYVNDLLTSLTD